MISVDIRTKERRSMPATLPALNLIAEPGRRRATLDTAREIERRGFAGISVSSSFGNMSQSVGLALATERIPFATAIAPIYAQSTDEFAQNAAYLHEVSGGRFQFGIGIAHAPAYVRMEVKPGKPERLCQLLPRAGLRLVKAGRSLIGRVAQDRPDDRSFPANPPTGRDPHPA
jgi:hypothetical protein